MQKPTKRGRGRPPKKASERKRNNVTTRLRDETKQNLETAAASSGCSLSEEIEFRLERSFWDDEVQMTNIHHKFGDSCNYAIALAMANIANQLSGQIAAPWTENEWIYRQVRKAFDTFLDGIAPPAGADKTGGRFISPAPKNKIAGKELAKYWLEFLQNIGGMDEETKIQEGLNYPAHNVRRIAFEVEPEIAPLIGRRK